MLEADMINNYWNPMEWLTHHTAIPFLPASIIHSSWCIHKFELGFVIDLELVYWAIPFLFYMLVYLEVNVIKLNSMPGW